MFNTVISASLLAGIETKRAYHQKYQKHVVYHGQCINGEEDLKSWCCSCDLSNNHWEQPIIHLQIAIFNFKTVNCGALM